MTRQFIKAGQAVIPLADIAEVRIDMLEEGVVTVLRRDGVAHDAHEFDAFEILMLLHPSALEGRRLRWAKNAWAFHNIVAHPLMQALVWLGFKKQAIRLHDATVPKPLGTRNLKAKQATGGV